jgi:hypothetical protein
MWTRVAINLQEGYGRAKRSEIIACRFSLRPPAGENAECEIKNPKQYVNGFSFQSAFRHPKSAVVSDIDEVAGSKL